MRKLFFIFVMLLATVTSAVAQESEPSETISTTGSGSSISFKGEYFTIIGDLVDGKGININDGNKITINSNHGEIITRVELSYGKDSKVKGAEYETVSSGRIDNNTQYPVANGNTIYDINATSLIIGSSVEGASNYFRIKKIVIHYELPNNGNEEEDDFVMDEYVQTVSFSLNGVPSCSKNNITVEGTAGNGDGLRISDSNYVTITADDGMEIVKVDLELSYNNGSPIESTAGNVKGSDNNWSINDIYSSTMTISNQGSGNVQIKNIKVYYREISEEKTEHFDVPENVIYRSGNSVSIIGTDKYNWHMGVTDGNSVTITANEGVEIAKVDLHFTDYSNTTKPIESTIGTIVSSDSYNCSINDVNSTSLTITHPGEDYNVVIDGITVYYRTKTAPATIEVAANSVDGAYWTTFYSNASNYQAPEGTQVFKVNLTGTEITMTEVEKVNRIIPKGQGVVLKSTTGNLMMQRTESESSDDYTDNSLMGTSVSITNPGNAYVLNYNPNTGGVGFYKLRSTGTIGINKAYLVYDGSGNGSATARAYFSFADASTGIEMKKVDSNEEERKVYDLQGRRVANPAKGLYIVNGKKVLMK